MLRRNRPESVASREQSKLQFSQALTSHEFVALRDIVNVMPDIKHKFKDYDKYFLSVDVLKERGDAMMKAGEDSFAIRYYAEGILTTVQQDKNGEYFCNQIIFILNNSRKHGATPIYLQCHFLIESYYEYESAKAKDDNKAKAIIKDICAKYLYLIQELRCDDFCDVDNFEIKDLKYLLFYWARKNNYNRLLPNIVYIRDPKPGCPSKGYLILRKEFNEEIFNSIPSQGEENGKLLLKLAYEVQPYDQPLSSKFAAKARSAFINSGFEAGITWINDFHFNNLEI